MKLIHGSIVLAILGCAHPHVAWAQGGNAIVQDARIERMQTEIQRLTAEVERLKMGESEQWMSERRADEIRSIVRDMLADADTRASLLGEGVTAGHDGDHFFLQSADEDFRLEISGQLQIRFTASHMNNSGGDDNRAGFSVHRARIQFDGHIFDSDITYSIKGGFDASTGDFRLVDAKIGYEVTDELDIKAGRFRAPFLREEDDSSKRLLMVDRSLVSKALGQDRTTGLGVEYKLGDKANFAASLMDGSNGFYDETDLWQATARIEGIIGDSWRQFDDYSSQPDEDWGMMFGAGLLYLRDAHPNSGGDEFSEMRWTADVSVEGKGLNLSAGIIGSHLRPDGGSNTNRYGIVVQGGVMLVDDWELVARYEWGTDPDEPPDLSIATIGVNKYFEGHAVKLSADIGYAFNGVSDFWDSTSAGWRQDADGEDGQIVVRTQFQLLF